MPKIFDCFPFCSELDLLELRLNELGDVVDFFVLAEATTTHRGAPKPLVFQQNKSQFAAFLPKIIHVVVDDMPGVGTTEPERWVREHFQRQALLRGRLYEVVVPSVDGRPADELCDHLHEQVAPAEVYYVLGQLEQKGYLCEEADSLPPGGVLSLRYFGRELVLFRTESGEPRVLDAFCPHLGAHLGHGGKVQGESIRCPFHGWCFDGRGACTAIPLKPSD